MKMNRIFCLSLISLAVFFFSGCATSPKKCTAKKNSAAHKGVSAKECFLTCDVLAFRDFIEADLDKDGVKEIVAVYYANNDSIGVKVIKADESGHRIIFNKYYSCGDVSVAIDNGLPVISVKKSKCIISYPKTVKYRWSGESFETN